MFDKEQTHYQHFRDIYAKATRRVLIWIGAGVSRPAGVPDWRMLRQHLDLEGEKKARTFARKDRESLVNTLTRIRGIANQWVAFEQLRDVLGPITFQTAIRQQLEVPMSVQTPGIYRDIWSLRIGGIINLNLDRLATKAFYETHSAQILHEFTGRNVGGFQHLLRGSAPFVANLHGIVTEVSSWIMTRAEIDALLSEEAYQAFVTSIFSANTILFLGISADDIAVGGLLANLRSKKVDPGTHFWVTDRTDSQTDKWAEQSGIAVIRYSPSDKTHPELGGMLLDLKSFLPPEVPGPPVPQRIPDELPSLPSPDKLAAMPPEDIRQLLNAHAAKLLAGKDRAEAERQYDCFLREYGRAIHMAWYISTRERENIVFGYKLDEVLGQGAFGRVYRGIGPKNEDVAVKILHEEVMGNKGMIGSFRRGVRSMQILSARKVAGMVPYKEAFELPACAIMDLVEGPNLQTAVEKRQIRSVWDKLRIARDVVRIVRTGHLLPEMVLHRDIRPANIMLRNFYVDPDNWEVVVLDFDLSWHRDAFEKSIDLKGSAALAYVAPEQLQQIPHSSTRTALVDSFGLGMTFFFLFAAKQPTVGGYQRADWASVVKDDIIKGCVPVKWQSLPMRLARIIIGSTVVQQAGRRDTSSIEVELDRLIEAESRPSCVQSAELWAEELLAKAFGPHGYQWDPDQFRGERVGKATGLVLKLGANEIEGSVNLTIGWTSAGDEDRKRLGKFARKAVDQASSQLTQNHWCVTASDVGDGWTINCAATARVSQIHASVDSLTKGLVQAVHAMSFQ